MFRVIVDRRTPGAQRPGGSLVLWVARPAWGSAGALGTLCEVEESRPSFSDELEAWLSADSPKTLGGLGEVFGERSFSVAVLILMLPAALPLPTGGITHVLEAVAVILGAEMLLGQSTIWLPRRWRARELGSTVTGTAMPRVLRGIRWLERHSRRRGTALVRSRAASRLIGLALILLAVAAAAAPPFSGLDTLPALGAVAVCLAVLLEDAVVLVLGLLIGLLGVVLSLALGAAALHFITRLW